jgi:nicotinate-nucleotide--dimethylbenzimidazole phosphoribosyltransferase
MSLEWTTRAAAALDEHARQAAAERQAQLIKPPGALGELEDLAIQLAAMQRTARPKLERVRIVVFAADHGVASEGVSAFPQAVTAEMVRNFARGSAAIAVLAKTLGADLEVVNLGTVGEIPPMPGVKSARIAAGTRNFALEPAMTRLQLEQALAIGRAAAAGGAPGDTQLFIGGEMGIANTTSAAAVAAALLGLPPEKLAGPGTGVDRAGVARKIAVIGRALALHAPVLGDPLEVLRCLGGFEIAGLAGAYLACAQAGIPLLVDGFIASVAALAATKILPGARQWM